jgi:pyruvate,orthophosphate dikinase
LQGLLPYQEHDFIEIFKAMEGLPVTIRLLDPPLHEFLPDLEDLLVEVTRLQGDLNCDKRERYEKEQLLRKVRRLKEHNPMLGLRGCRLGILFPEIYDMQIEAIMRAVKKIEAMGKRIYPEIMIPLVGHDTELETIKRRVLHMAAQYNVSLPVGTMIEVPRAALTADQIAREADFFSFGTNDLTQTTLGFSRDDAETKFMHGYLEQKIIQENPFVTLDVDGVGKLMKMAVTLGKSANPPLKIGICGEHGGDKKSILFCSRLQIDYLSCSPYRIPLARLAAAQAQLEEPK